MNTNENKEVDMDRFKFRAWDFSIEEMITTGDDRRWGTVTNHYIFRNYDHDAIMQYTGLKDKNGTPIYECDIIKCDISMHISGTLPHMGEVVYIERLCSFATKNDGGETLFVKHLSGSREVIGNKFEDKHLLE